MGMADSAMMMDEGEAERGAMPGMPGMPSGSDTGGDEPDCPFAPAGPVQGCAAAASLPAHAMGAPVPLPDAAGSVFTDVLQQDLLLNADLFHPPRA